MQDRKQANQVDCQTILLICTQLGYNNKLNTWEGKKEIAEAVCRIVSYDYGFKKVLAMTQVATWMKKFANDLTIGLTKTFLDMKHNGTISYTVQVQSRHLTYLHDFYHYATEILGDSAIFKKEVSNSQ